MKLILCVVSLVCWASLALAQSPTPTPDNLVSYREASCVLLSAVPQAIGSHIRREEIILHNEADSAGDLVCGYDVTTVSFTPGPTSGDELAPGEGKTICTFADKIQWCIALDNPVRVCFDEARLVTPTPTPTPP